MKLIGAIEFLRTVKRGTLCAEFWRNEKICKDIINDYNNGIDIVNKYGGEIFLFGNNGGSLAFLKDDFPEIETINGIDYDYLFEYDKNIYGDASPSETLYLIFENENEYPAKVKIEGTEEFISIEEIKIIQKWYANKYCEFDKKCNKMALYELKNDKYYKNNYICNYRS